MNWTYFVLAAEQGRLKIGRATDPKARLSALRTASPCELELVALLHGEEWEGWFHRTFASNREHLEWFRPTYLLVATIHYLVGRQRDLPEVRAFHHPAYWRKVERWRRELEDLAQSDAVPWAEWGRVKELAFTLATEHECPDDAPIALAYLARCVG